MAMLLDGDFTIVTKNNEIELEKFKNNNNIGFFTYKNKKEELITQEIVINNIQDVYNCSNKKLLETYISYGYFKNFIIRKFLIFKEKIIKFVEVECGFYSQNLYSCYSPYGMFPLKFIKLTKEESLNFYFKNQKESNNYSNLFD